MRGIVIVAGGSGSRMGTALPKQYLDLCGEPIMVHTIKKFFDFDPEIEMVLVLPESDLDRWEDIKKRFLPHAQIKVTTGGKTRFHSVKNGIQEIKNASLVGIHDAVRPLVSARTLEFCYSSAQKHRAAVPVFPMKSSLRTIDGEKSKALDRSTIVAVQTPQCFTKDLLDSAFEQEYHESFTDDATVIEKYGAEVFCVDGNEENIKITTPYDLQIAEVLINSGF